GVKSGRRNVFLDNEQDRSYISAQLGQAVRVAKKKGASIVICHPHPATIKTLAALLPGLEKQGITLVSASRLVK
ncbi:MAG: divergent polysaccharide deacetylase family protein, partial [Pseudomonadota bacterium]